MPSFVYLEKLIEEALRQIDRYCFNHIEQEAIAFLHSPITSFSFTFGRPFNETYRVSPCDHKEQR